MLITATYGTRHGATSARRWEIDDELTLGGIIFADISLPHPAGGLTGRKRTNPYIHTRYGITKQTTAASPGTSPGEAAGETLGKMSSTWRYVGEAAIVPIVTFSWSSSLASQGH